MSDYNFELLELKRTEKGLSQEELSDKSGVSIEIIKQIEAGSAASFETADALAEALELKTHKALQSRLNNVADDVELSGLVNELEQPLELNYVTEARKPFSTALFFKRYANTIEYIIGFISVLILSEYLFNTPDMDIDEMATTSLVWVLLIAIFGRLLSFLLKYITYPKVDQARSLGVFCDLSEAYSGKLKSTRTKLYGAKLDFDGDLSQAMELAKNHDLKAVATLATIHLRGILVPRNEDLAYRLLAICGKNGCIYSAITAMVECNIHGITIDNKSANDWSSIADQNGYENREGYPLITKYSV